jgi:hypothetical protein
MCVFDKGDRFRVIDLENYLAFLLLLLLLKNFASFTMCKQSEMIFCFYFIYTVNDVKNNVIYN